MSPEIKVGLPVRALSSPLNNSLSIEAYGSSGYIRKVDTTGVSIYLTHGSFRKVLEIFVPNYLYGENFSEDLYGVYDAPLYKSPISTHYRKIYPQDCRS
ncbi:hypothetical protein GCM10027592_22120 [Spirosoma flavus]